MSMQILLRAVATITVGQFYTFMYLGYTIFFLQQISCLNVKELPKPFTAYHS